MTQAVRKGKKATIAFTANTKITDDLSRGVVYRELYVRLSGQLAVAAAANTAAATLRGDEWAVIKKLEVIANGVEVIRSLTGNDLWWLNYFLYKSRPTITPGIGDAATLNPAFDSLLILPLWSVDTVRPMDTALDSRVLSSLEVSVEWGTFTDINAAATAFTVAPSIEIYSAESFNIAGPFSNWRQFVIDRSIVATTPQFQIELPVGAMYRGFLINTVDAGVDSGAIINNFKLTSGSTVFTDYSEPVLRQVPDIRRGTQRSFDDTGNVYDDLRRGNANSLAGWYFYDHVMDGLLTEAIDTLSFSEFKIELDVTVGGGATSVRVIPNQIIPVRGNANR